MFILVSKFSSFIFFLARMVFYFIGLGLSHPEDISVRGLRLVQGAKRVYLEMYTAILMASKDEIEKTYGRKACFFFLEAYFV